MNVSWYLVFFYLLTLIVFGSIAWRLHCQQRGEGRKVWWQYLGSMPDLWHLPLYFAMLLIVAVVYGSEGYYSVSPFSSLIFGTSLYALLILPLLPLLRRHFSAQCCAVLWQLPAIAHLCADILLRSFRKPLILIPVSESWLNVVWKVWLGGVLLLLSWSAVSHLLFRRRVMAFAEPVREQWMLNIWEEEMARVLPKRVDAELVTSFEVRSPLSIGVFQGTTVVVLPREKFTEQELRLILRHELIHIGRRDGMRKFYFWFSASICWFNPLVWLMHRKCAEDLERSCDESVLTEESAPVRRQYAELILGAAGEERGFSSCLAASASALRYRLKSIVKPSPKRSGALLVFTLCVILFLAAGRIVIGYEATTIQAVVEERGGFAIASAEMPEKGACRDAETLKEMLWEARLYRVMGIGADLEETTMTVTLDNHTRLSFGRYTLTVTGGGREKVVYYLPESVDLQALAQLFGA